MNHKNFNHIVKQFINHFSEFNNVEGIYEGFKWEALRCFQDHWNIDAEDFKEMFEKSMEKAILFCDAGASQPIGGILLLLKSEENNNNVEFVRECFRKLFQEDENDIQARLIRVDEFIDAINEKIKNYVVSTWKYPQNRNSVIYYLNLWRPEENYIYKSAEAVTWANAIEYGDDFGIGKHFKLDKYYKMCEDVREEILHNEELLAIHYERFTNQELPYEDQLHLLVYDLIHCLHTYHLSEGIEISKLTTKQRIKQAALTEAKETLEEEILNCQEKLDQIKSGELELDLPDLEGMSVTHKKFGSGIVSKQNEANIEVTFPLGVKAFKIPMAITNGFLTLQDEHLSELLSDLKENLDGVDKLERQIVSKKLELELLLEK